MLLENYEKAKENYEKAIEYNKEAAERLKTPSSPADIEQLAQTYLNICTIYNLQKDYAQTIKEAQAGIDLQKELDKDDKT